LTAVRLFEKEKLAEIKTLLKKTADAFLNFADLHKDIPMPGYTHTRKAMLSSVALWAGGYAELFLIQLEASCGIQSMINRSPLGTAAGFGTSFPVDRETEAEELGFATPIVCSTTAQLSRGWIELQFTEYLCGITAILNRFASDLIRFSSEGSPFFDLHEDVCTGSSIMPQKKNPDVAELLRAGHSVLLGEASKLRSLTINLGSGYHRDLQLTKEPLINSIQKTKELLAAAQLLIEYTEPVEENLVEACSGEIFMAEAAYQLVKEKGIPFREAYQEVKTEGHLSKIDVKKTMTAYTHIGSPGNAGIEDLRSKLDAFQL
jgi:argininosuccinate lyase